MVSHRVFADSNLDPRFRAGLVGHWIGGGSGLTWFDRSGCGYHGTLTNGPTWTLGEGGKRDAVEFDGVNDYVLGPTNSAHDMSSAGFSLSAWIRLTNVSAFHAIASKWSGGLGWYVATSSTGLVDFSFAGVDRYGTKVLTAGRWTHVGATYDGASGRIYVDGVLDTTFSLVAGSAPGTPLHIGGVSGTTFPMAGTIDDLRIYQRTLSGAEVATLANPAYSPIIIGGGLSWHGL